MRELRDKLFNKLEGTRWDEAFRFYIKSQDFEQILEELREQVEQGYRFTPAIKHIFKPFELCPLNQVKIVFLLPEPWLDPTLNNGLALHCNESSRIDIGLYRFLQELSAIHPQHTIKGDLTSIARQGCLLLNCSFTAQIGTPGKHAKLWFPLLLNALEVLNQKSLMFVGFGDLECWGYVADHHFKLKVPALPKHQDDPYSYKQLFVEIDNYLKSKNISKIIW